MKKILLSALAMVAVATTSAQDLNATLEKAISSYSAKDYSTAADCLKTIITEGIDDDSAADLVATAKQYLPQCYYFLGGQGFTTKDYAAARTNFQKAAEYAELYDDIATMTKSNQWIGRTYELQGGMAFNAKNYAEALPVFEMGCAADPRNAKMKNWLGICYAETGAFEKAVEVFDSVVAAGTANPKYAAEATAAKANIELYTNNYIAYLQKNKNYAGIIALANKMLAKNPKDAIAAKSQIQAYSDMKSYAKVVELAESAAAVQSTPEEKSNIYFTLAAAYNALDKKAEAVSAFKKVTAGTNVATAKESAAELLKQLVK